MIEHADLAELVEAHCRSARPGRAQRAVHQRLTPGRKMWSEREHDRWRVLGGRGLERLRADEHADIEQDRRDRDHRYERQQH